MRRRLASICVLLLFIACSSSKSEPEPEKRRPRKHEKKQKPEEPELDWSTPDKKQPVANVPVAPLLPMGVSRPSDFSYLRGRGRAHYRKAEIAAEKQKPDWAAVKKQCQAAIAADPGHLHAHYLLAVALARLGELDAVAEPLSVVLAGDWLQWGPGLERDPSLVQFLASDAGGPVARQNQAYGDEFRELVAGALLVVARRSHSAPPKPRGLQWAGILAELFAYLPEQDRYLRLTHTDDSLAGWLRAPSGKQLAYVTYSKVSFESEEAPPLIDNVEIGTIDLTTLASAPPVELVGTPLRDVRVVRLQYLDGDQLMVQTAGPTGRWGVAEPESYRLEPGAGKLVKLDEPKPGVGPRLEVAYDWIDFDRGPSPDIEAEDQASFFKLPGGQVVKLPTGEYVEKDGYRWSPDRDLLAVRTMGRPCVGNPESALFLVEARTGKFVKLYAGKSNLGIEWLDASRFAYEDADGGIRIYDAAKREQVGVLPPSAEVALHGLAAHRGAICKEGSGAGAGENGELDE